jgi:uncharacterized membrane protein YphA (DoxX/SURF4 family)
MEKATQVSHCLAPARARAATIGAVTSTTYARMFPVDGFYKNLSILGGFLLLYVTGAGKYSIDALRSVAAP